MVSLTRVQTLSPDMPDTRHPQSGSNSQLQEAIDVIAQSFGYPETLSIEYTSRGGQKKTIFKIQTGDSGTTYELVYNGQDDNAEPVLNRIDEDR